MKTCYVCGAKEPAAEFYATQRMCKPCQKQHDKRRTDRATRRNDTPAARARKQRWRKANQTPFKDAARIATRRAIQAGALVRPDTCSECGNGAKRADGVSAIQAHHDDYTKPLAIRWLCAKCHSAWHRTNAAIAAQGAGHE